MSQVTAGQMRDLWANMKDELEALNVKIAATQSVEDANASEKLAALEEKLIAVENTLNGTLSTKQIGDVVEVYFEGTSSTTRTFTDAMTGVSIANDGLENLTFTINGVTRKVYAGEVYNGNLQPFTTININASDNFRVEVLR